MNTDAPAKIEMIRGSIRCFICGLIGLLPVIGVPFALAALWISGRVRPLEWQFWNPARTYRRLGVVSAAVGIIFWFFVLSLIIYHAVAGNSGYGGIYRMSGDD